MARLLIWILLAVVAYAVVRNWSRAGAKRARAATDQAPEAIVACAACGLNVPQSVAGSPPPPKGPGLLKSATKA